MWCLMFRRLGDTSIDTSNFVTDAYGRSQARNKVLGGRRVTAKQKAFLWCLDRADFRLIEIPVEMNNGEVIKFFDGCTYGEISVFNLLVKLCRRKNTYFPSQGQMSKWLGLSRATVNRALKKFSDAKLIPKFYQHMRSCLYKISSVFADPRMRSALSHIVMAFGLLPFSLLKSKRQTANMSGSDDNVTHYNVYTYSKFNLEISNVTSDGGNLARQTEKKEYAEKFAKNASIYTEEKRDNDMEKIKLGEKQTELDRYTKAKQIQDKISEQLAMKLAKEVIAEAEGKDDDAREKLFYAFRDKYYGNIANKKVMMWLLDMLMPEETDEG